MTNTPDTPETFTLPVGEQGPEPVTFAFGGVAVPADIPGLQPGAFEIEVEAGAPFADFVVEVGKLPVPYGNGDHETRNGRLHIANRVDAEGRPAGGSARAVGLKVEFQTGPLGRDGDRLEPNGCFVETLLDVVAARLAFYQDGQFACAENAAALTCVRTAIAALNARTERREAAGVEGTHEGN